MLMLNYNVTKNWITKIWKNINFINSVYKVEKIFFLWWNAPDFETLVVQDFSTRRESGTMMTFHFFIIHFPHEKMMYCVHPIATVGAYELYYECHVTGSVALLSLTSARKKLNFLFFFCEERIRNFLINRVKSRVKNGD